MANALHDAPAQPRIAPPPDNALASLGGWVVLAVTLSVFAAVAGFVAVVQASRDTGPRAPAAVTSPAASAGPFHAAVTLGDMFIRPAALTVPAGSDVTLDVKNTGAVTHDLTVEGTTTTTGGIAAGGSATLHVGALAKSATIICSIPGHKEAGMAAALTVAGTAPTGPGAGQAATIDPAATPAADFHPYDARLKPAPGGTMHRVTLHATEEVLTVAPGVTQEMWTFNGSVPAPTLRGQVGDLFRVTLVNDGKMGHSLDFHASEAPWDTQMRTIAPGEKLRYDFRARYAGIFMYHCGTAPALHHIGNGMYGAVVVDPPSLPKVDHEYVIVQSELYLGPQGGPGDLTKMTNVTPDAVVFNGYWNQYKFAPLKVMSGDRVRVWVLDAGPSENSSFHIVGTIFSTVFKEGAYLLRPDASRGGSQALDLQPAQGGFVEFTAGKTGYYPIVTHKFANVGKGALGLVQVGEPGAMTGGGH
jgi:nitrite reductase (NO-forming)